jgi:hypothetical protein
MRNWQYIGLILVVVAALITAGKGCCKKIQIVQKELYNWGVFQEFKQK